MTPALPRELTADALTAIEDLELPLLSWGVTTAAISQDELASALTAAADLWTERGNGFVEPDDLLDHFIDRGYVLAVPGTSPRRYRTRLAEALRLAANLRQLFPPSNLSQPSAGWWRSGRPLVADYRLHVSARKVPRRDVEPLELLGQLRDVPGWQKVQDDVAQAFIGDRRLSRFQVQSGLAINEVAGSSDSRGVVIGAGTGAGKTLAFYLPAFAHLAGQLQAETASVSILGLYPRKELLRDQVREAIVAARQVESVLRSHDRRPIRIGALYGDTPHSADGRGWEANGYLATTWPSLGSGRRCPYLDCPECLGPLMWSDADRRAGTERLSCTRCQVVITDQAMALTRQAMTRKPPDLLFTTTEMLSQRATDPKLGRLLGWGAGRHAPRLVLMDEAHTYSGVTGAQVGLLIRRWRNSNGRQPIGFVGLSATLRDAASFFARLTGLHDTHVEYIQAAEQDLTSVGRQYALALRGDPISGASLLSTSIQTAMLFGRLLDPKGQEDLHGSRGFLFTDDLDVTNRFFDDLRDAEGKQNRRNGRLFGPVLAALRSPDAPQVADRYHDGQSWDIVTQLGRPLPALADGGQLRIGRTSSQDSGVDQDADLIVATASLEVGFNDPTVGLVVQHKAPIDSAAFIQRRGRAGRRSDMRPWTVVTLSDYGRDRLAYQAYESLFEPELSANRLPIGNRYVLKIQGTQSTLDWLARRLARSGHAVDPRQLLKAPRQAPASLSTSQEALAVLMEEILTRSATQDELARHLRFALNVSDDEVQALLWEPPRALLTAVIPTGLRRLRSGWKPRITDPGAEPGALLPEFITRALFEPLNVPEVRLRLPFGEDESMTIAQALREAVPGRVSRRFGHRRDDHRTWLPLPPPGTEEIELSTIVTGGLREQSLPNTALAHIDIVRPLSLQLVEPPAAINSSSQSRPRWVSAIQEAPTGSHAADKPSPPGWTAWLAGVGFATHAYGNSLLVQRATTGARADLRYTNGVTETRDIVYQIDGEPAALGFTLDVDALRITTHPLNISDPGVRSYLNTSSWRTAAFAWRIMQDQDLDLRANDFQRSWLTLVYLTALTIEHLRTSNSTELCCASLRLGRWGADIQGILGIIYRADDASPAPERLISTLTELIAQTDVQQVFDRHAALLYEDDISVTTKDLARRSHLDTLAAATLAAVLRVNPDADERDLIVDVQGGPGVNCVSISETSVGGLGIIEDVARAYGADPRRFWRLVLAALGPSEYERNATSLKRLLRHAQDDTQGQLALGLSDFRLATSLADSERAIARITRAWTELDGPPQHSTRVFLTTRLLRPGSDAGIDAQLLAVSDAWQALEARLGIEVDSRVVAYAAAKGVLTEQSITLNADQLFSLLWPRGADARNRPLAHYNPYADAPMLDRLLITAAHPDAVAAIDVTSTDWEGQYVERLSASGAVELRAPSSARSALAAAVRAVQTLPVDQDVLRLYGLVRSFHYSEDSIAVRVELAEAIQ
jgi:ATP-dependent Lhr-like helicase